VGIVAHDVYGCPRRTLGHEQREPNRRYRGRCRPHTLLNRGHWFGAGLMRLMIMPPAIEMTNKTKKITVNLR
jgi:hypothetical protein